MLADGGERFADSASVFARDPSSVVCQNVFLFRNLHLLLIENAVRAASPGAKAQKILAANAIHAPLEDRGAGQTLAYLPRQLRSQTRLRWLAHQPQGLLNAVIRDEAQKWRLLKLHREALTQGTVEYRVACFICDRLRSTIVSFCVKTGARCQRHPTPAKAPRSETTTAIAQEIPPARDRFEAEDSLPEEAFAGPIEARLPLGSAAHDPSREA